MATTVAAPEMKGPVKSVLWVHNAILRETRTFQEAVARIGSDASPDVSSLLEQFQFFRKVLEFHEESEDRDVFPLLEEHYRHATDTYEYDHRRQQALYGEIQDGLQALVKRGVAGPARDVSDLQQRAQQFGTAMELHVAKENELLFPLYDQTFSVEEQVAINTRIQQEHAPAPELMGQMVPWMFRLQTPDDRVAVAQFFLAMFPPEGRPGLVKMLSGGVTPDEWAEVTRRVPDLAA
jgi:hemerythrin-like domain-containing protein